MLRLTKSDPKKLQFTNEKTNRNIMFLFFSGVSFTSRQFSRVRLHEAEPGGTYYIMVEAMQDIRNLTMEMKLINDKQEQENSRRIFDQNSNNQRIPKILEESMRSSFSWPRRLSVP